MWEQLTRLDTASKSQKDWEQQFPLLHFYDDASFDAVREIWSQLVNSPVKNQVSEQPGVDMARAVAAAAPVTEAASQDKLLTSVLGKYALHVLATR